MSSRSAFPVEGGCACKHIRYKMLSPPLVTHCCYCTWCQRETGTAFVLNAVIEADRVVPMTMNKLLVVPTPTHSGEGQQIHRCPKCYVALWSDYGSGGLMKWVRIGTLDRPEVCPPSVHLFTENKQPWVKLPGNEKEAPVFEQSYKKDEVWSKESLERLHALKKETMRSS